MGTQPHQPPLQRHLTAAREEERRRWARELHDDTLQGLAALRVQLSSARRADDADQLRAALDGAVDELGREIANLRALITELRPASLDELGLQPALEHLLDRAAVAHRLKLHAVIELDAGRDGRLDADVETAVYRVVQEALTNAGRHAHARQVDIEVIERNGEIAVRVADDGQGFDVTEPTFGCGLTGMRERMVLVGGRLEIGSSRQGTRVAAKLPASVRPGGGRRAMATAVR